MAAGIISSLRQPPAAPPKLEIPPGACSFCGKDKPEVYVIQGPAVAICNECVGLCVDMLRDEKVPLGAPYLTVHYKTHGQLERFVMPAKGRVLRYSDAGWSWGHMGEGSKPALVWSPELDGDASQEFVREHVYNGLGYERGTVHVLWRALETGGFRLTLIHIPSEVQEERVTGDKPPWAFEL